MQINQTTAQEKHIDVRALTAKLVAPFSVLSMVVSGCTESPRVRELDRPLVIKEVVADPNFYMQFTPNLPLFNELAPQNKKNMEGHLRYFGSVTRDKLDGSSETISMYRLYADTSVTSPSVPVFEINPSKKRATSMDKPEAISGKIYGELYEKVNIVGKASFIQGKYLEKQDVFVFIMNSQAMDKAPSK